MGELGERLASRVVPTPGPSTPSSLAPCMPAAEEVLGDAGFAGKVDASHQILVKSSGRCQCPPTPCPLYSHGSWKLPCIFGRGVSHATRPGGADSALAFCGGGRSSRSPLHILMKTTALGKFPKSLSRGEADGGSLAQPYHSPGLRSQTSSPSLTHALTLRYRSRAHGVFEGPNDDNICYVFHMVWATADNWSYYCAQRFCSLSWGHREKPQRP